MRARRPDLGPARTLPLALARPLQPLAVLRDETLRLPLRAAGGNGRHGRAIAPQGQPVIARARAPFENDVAFRRRPWPGLGRTRRRFPMHPGLRGEKVEQGLLLLVAHVRPE